MDPETSPHRRPLRLWPGVIAVALQWFLWLILPSVAPGASMIGMLGGVACGAVVVLWWLFFSRAPWAERLGAIVLMVVAVAATKRVVHESIANGMMGMMLPFYSIPALSLALVAAVVLARRLSTGQRRASIVASVLLACAVFTIIRTGGMSGAADSDLHWRWTPTPEERLLAQAGDERLEAAPVPVPSTPPAARTPETAPPVEAVGEAPPPPPPAASARGAMKTSETPAAAPLRDEPAAPRADPVGAKSTAEWPGFRGPGRDGVIRGVRIETDWSRSAPVELWRRPIGPGWSSFAVDGAVFYTQEQRGGDEVVSSYKLATGAPVWRHRDAARFWESNAGAGPRATPTLGNGRVYTLGATGILNALDARTGSAIWSRNAASDTGAKNPGWGFAGSPLVVDDVVVVAVSGKLAAYDARRGTPRWSAKTRGSSYSSPHLVTIDGIPQILLLTGTGVTSVAPADGRVLWEHAWPGVPMLQPARTANGDLLITSGDMSGGMGTRRIAVVHKPDGWSAEERWTSRGLKPYLNDFVVHKGHAFGFDGSILSCIDLEDGTRKWKGGRYGNGQLVLLPDQDVLLVVSEEGELALVAATPDQFAEIARVPALEGKTWNHPVLVGGVLLVRNSEEMAAFRLALARP